MAVFLILVEK